MTGQTYRVTAPDVRLWTRSYVATTHGRSFAVTPQPPAETPLTEGDVVTLLGYRPTSPGSDVIDAAYFRRESDGAVGFMRPAGSWGTVNTDVLEETP